MDSIPVDIPTVAVIREPHKRFTSSFIQTQQLDFTGQKKYRCRDIPHSDIQKVYRNEDPVDELMAYLDEIEGNGFWDRHQCPQTWFLSGKIVPYHRRRVDQISIWLKLENLAQELHQKISPKIILRHDNVKPAPLTNKYRAAAEKCRDKIRSVYAEDFELYERFGSSKQIDA